MKYIVCSGYMGETAQSGVRERVEGSSLGPLFVLLSKYAAAEAI